MGKLTALICKGCGGLIDRESLICTSCGTQYKYDDDGRLITAVQYDRRILYIEGGVAIPSYIVKDDPELAMKMSLEEIAREMAKKILPLIEFSTRFEPCRQEFITQARLGVAEPFEYSRQDQRRT